jgi:hypothetical protein
VLVELAEQISKDDCAVAAHCLAHWSPNRPTRELINDLLDNRPEVYRRAKEELLTRLANTKKEHLIELVEMEAEHSKPASK